MKIVQHLLSWLLVLQLSGLPALLAQPVIIQPGAPFGNQQAMGSGIENLRVGQRGPEGTEVQLTMDYSYDGFGGPVAQVLPVIGKKGQQGVSGWFGADPVTVGRGKGTITLRVRYFNDEPGVPAMFISDQVRILILNQNGTALISAVPFLKTINWGSPTARPDQKSVPVLARVDTAAAERLAQEKREAEARAQLEVAAREKARLQAEAEVKARKEAEEKARTEALAREEARKKAQEETERIALESQKAEESRLAQQKAREEQRKFADAKEKARQEAEAKAAAQAKALADSKAAADAKALADAKVEAEAKALADAKVTAEAKARADAKAAAEAKARADAKAAAEAKALADASAAADAKARAEAKTREEARLKAQAEERRLAEEKRAAEERVLAEGKARKEAEDKAWQEALAQAKAELAAKKLSEEKAQAEALAQGALVAAPASARNPESFEITRDKKTRVTNVDVVNRSMDRTQMTFGVEFEYKDQLGEPMLGVDIYREGEPEVSHYFVSHPTEIGKSRRNFALFPVKFQPPANISQSGDFPTDKVLVYLTDKRAQRFNIFPATMLLRWRASGSERSSAEPSNANLVEIEDFTQNDPSSGHISVKYNLLAGKGKLRARVYDQSVQASAAYFTSDMPEVQAGRDLRLIDVRIDAEAKSPSDLVRADTIEVELLDLAGNVLARTSKNAAMVWTRPKQ